MIPPVAPGDVIASKYAVERVLGQGGMGVVVAARHLGLDERVALKLLPTSDEPSDAIARRLKREARAAARLKSKHAVRVADIGQLDDGSPFLVMEFVEGQTFAEVLQQRGALPFREAVDLLLQALDAVAEAHSLGIVHRDIKPSNLMLSRLPDGSAWVYVLDFGIAKVQGNTPGATLTKTSAVLGSPSYMSPEQIRDAHRVDERSDQWSIGVTLYQLLSGALPFQGSSSAAVLASIAADPPIPIAQVCPEVPDNLDAVIGRCLQKNPASRYPDLAVLAAALEPFGSSVSAGAAERIARVLRGSPSRDLVISQGGGGDDRTQVSQGIETRTAAPTRAARPAVARGWLVALVPLLGLGLWWGGRSSGAPTEARTPPVAPANPSVSAQPPAPSGEAAPAVPPASVVQLSPEPSASIAQRPVSGGPPKPVSRPAMPPTPAPLPPAPVLAPTREKLPEYGSRK